MENDNDDQRTPFGSIGGDEPTSATPAPPPPPAAAQAPASPIPPVAPTPPASTPAASPQSAASSFNTVSSSVPPAAAQPQFQQGAYPTPEKKSKLGWIIGGVVVLFMILGGGVIALLAFARLGSEDTETSSNEEVVVEEVDEADQEVNSDGGAEVQDVEVEDDPVEDEDDSDVPLGTVTDPMEEDVTSIEVAEGDFLEVPAGIAANGFDTYLIDLEAGSTVEVTAQSNGDEILDSMMRILDPDGAQIAFNDDAPAEAGLSLGVDPQVSFVADTAGEYTIEVLGFNAVTEGDYLLTVNRTGQVLDLTNAGAPSTSDDEVSGGNEILGVEDEVVLTTGPNEVEVIEGSIEDNQYVDVYEIDLEGGETVLISLVADPAVDLDLALTVFDIDFNIVGFDDDAGPVGVLSDDLNPELEFVAPATGTYFLNLIAFAQLDVIDTGAYVMTIQRGEGNEAALQVEELADLPSSLVVASGESIEVAGSVGSDDAFDLILNAGDEVTLTIKADDPDDLDPTVTLSFGGWVVDFNDDAQDAVATLSPLDSQLTVSTANNGLHTIDVGGFGGSTGAFTMTVEVN